MLSYLMSLFPITVSKEGSFFDVTDKPLYSNPPNKLKIKIQN